MNASDGKRLRGSDLGGLSQLAIAATLAVTDLVESVHHTIARRTAPLGPPPSGRAGGIAGLVYASVRGTTRGIGALLDLALPLLAGWRAQAPSTAARDTWIAALNGVMGDRLAAEGNALALDMQIERAALPWRDSLVERPPGGRLLVLVHGLCMHPGQWRRQDHDHGMALAQEFGLDVLHLRYNSGLDIASNGRRFSDQLDALISGWPVPITGLHLLGHSMGGLVIRAACRTAASAFSRWLPLLRSVAFLGTPHRGSPIERAGQWLQSLLAHSPYTLPFTALGGLRSAGIQDLRFGNLGGDLQPALPRGVAALAVAGSGGATGHSLRERLLGDGLVPVHSALGRAAGAARPELFKARQRHLLPGIDHFGLLDAPVYDVLRAFHQGLSARTVRG